VHLSGELCIYLRGIPLSVIKFLDTNITNLTTCIAIPFSVIKFADADITNPATKTL
jgi:hypothetical protein